MPKASRRAGQNIRELALERRTKAIISFIAAGFVVVFPFILVKIFEDFLKNLSSLSPSEPPDWSTYLSGFMPCLG
jgi:hypothetical protein